MNYQYQAFGIPVHSEIELPALASQTTHLIQEPFYVYHDSVPESLVGLPTVQNPFSIFNEHELRYELPDVARYYIAQGQRITIEPLCDDWGQILLYFYSNCLAAVLFQRNFLPLHVSGVFIKSDKVVLLAAPSRTGKSTTAVMLQERGYQLFTDDVALIIEENYTLFAQASYPMVKLWENAFKNQNLFSEKDKYVTFSEINKHGFLFQDNFQSQKVELAGIIFLASEGVEIEIQALSQLQSFELLKDNIYRKQWVDGMNKTMLQFETLTKIASKIPAWKAIRPKNSKSFKSFAKAIETQILRNLC